jgi:predicted transposase YbfD/YdcC
MQKDLSASFAEHFSKLKDPRINRKKLYPLMEILFVILCGTICGADSWRDYVIFGKEKLDFLTRYFPFENGIPSKNTFARVIASMNTDAFKTCFIQWIQSVHVILRDVVAIDGKTLRHSFDTAKEKTAIHMVSAFATEARLVLGQIKVSNKTNEITAIPMLLDLLELSGAIITIDAMGCQKEIAQKIIEKKADYILSLKGNHSNLHEDVKLFLETEALKKQSNAISDTCQSVDAGHGRIETRQCWVSDKIDWLKQKAEWSSLNAIAMIEEIRESGEKVTKECRFFLTSLPADAKLISSSIRAHWGIENTLHWTLDMTFREDESRIRSGNAAENMSVVRHISLNMLQNARKSEKDVSIRGLRKKAGWGNSTLDHIIRQNF